MAKTVKKTARVDRLDMRILAEVAQKGRQTITELSKSVGLSSSPCTTRLERLEADGIIIGYEASIDVERLADLSLYYVTIAGKPWTPALGRKIEELMTVNPYIVSADHLFGSIDYLLRIYVRSTHHFHEIMAPFLEFEVDYETWPVSRSLVRMHMHRLLKELQHDQD
jgi:Lrp/AsnC family leucine-responsive transcriptional regulator